MSQNELETVQDAIKEGLYFFTQHASIEAIAEDITEDHIKEAVLSGQIVENYPQHRRGACCLLSGSTKEKRTIHIVCTTKKPTTIITVYEPKPPKWITPLKRGKRQ